MKRVDISKWNTIKKQIDTYMMVDYAKATVYLAGNGSVAEVTFTTQYMSGLRGESYMLDQCTPRLLKQMWDYLRLLYAERKINSKHFVVAT